MHTLASATAAEQNHGWGGPLALIAAVAIFYAGIKVWDRLKALRAGDVSPTPPGTNLVPVDPQVSHDLTPVDPTSGHVSHEWGAVDYSTSQGRQLVLPRTATTTVVKPRASRADVAGWLRGRVGKAGTNQIIREAEQATGASTATVKRALRDLRGGKGKGTK